MNQILHINTPENACWFHRWAQVGQTGVTTFEQCLKCGARCARRPAYSGYQPFNRDWVNRETDTINGVTTL